MPAMPLATAIGLKRSLMPPALRHPDPRIHEPPIERGRGRAAVDGHRQVAERVGGVRGPVVHWARAEHAQRLVIVRRMG